MQTLQHETRLHVIRDAAVDGQQSTLVAHYRNNGYRTIRKHINESSI